ncbi:hypothetical protein Sjap_005083 [Stephania japonica]|uniref:Uncharacterized protein n=1 Tax=Stephania japonica TaxID=461633 RepID=A0AAP0PKT5_9MAGN
MSRARHRLLSLAPATSPFFSRLSLVFLYFDLYIDEEGGRYKYDPLDEAAAANSGHALDHGPDRLKFEHDRLARYLMQGHTLIQILIDGQSSL